MKLHKRNRQISLVTGKKEHIENVKGSNIANHAWSYHHRIDFDAGNHRVRKSTLERGRQSLLPVTRQDNHLFF